MEITMQQYENNKLLGNTVYFQGDINTSNHKQSYTSKRTLSGRKRQLYSNPYRTLSVNVTYMDVDNYEGIVDFFYGSHSVFIETEDGETYIAMFEGDALSLSKNNRSDTEIDTYYYSGSFSMEE